MERRSVVIAWLRRSAALTLGLALGVGVTLVWTDFGAIKTPPNFFEPIGRTASNGDVEARLMVARNLLKGDGVAVDFKEGTSRLEQLYNEGVAQAAADLALAYGTEERADYAPARAREWLQRGLEAKIAEAYLLRGSWKITGKVGFEADIAGGASDLETAYELGSGHAAMLLGLIYYGRFDHSPKGLIYWYCRAPVEKRAPLEEGGAPLSPNLCK